ADARAPILHHHERYDGRGYPGGLKGDDIPLSARILAVADSADAMFSPRSYKPAYHLDRVCAELAAKAGTQFDPDVVDVATSWLDERPERTLPATTDLRDEANPARAQTPGQRCRP
ncbi:MAG: hypothetical protein KJ749_03670, partial [Planctomycetes bacterium]|nr:hypothetical protein [Planctomycetota bacterium]